MKKNIEEKYLVFNEAGYAFLISRPGCGDGNEAGIKTNLSFINRWPSEPIEYLVWHVTSAGRVKCTWLYHYKSATRKAGLQGFELNKDERIVYTFLSKDEVGDVFIATKNGKIIRFSADAVLRNGRKDYAGRGINFQDCFGQSDDAVCDAFFLAARNFATSSIGALTANGFTTRFSTEAVRQTARGTSGVLISHITEQTGPIVAVGPIDDQNCWNVLCSTNEITLLNWKSISVQARNSGFKKTHSTNSTQFSARILGTNFLSIFDQ